MISIITANYNTADWLKLMFDSLDRYCTEFPEVIVVDNSRNIGVFQDYPTVKIIAPESNIGHGAALDLAIRNTKADYVLALDSDAHVMRQDWESDLLEEFSASGVRMVAAQGNELKPFRPCAMAVDRRWFIDGGYSFEAVPVAAKGGFMTLDVGVFAAIRALHDGYKVVGMPYGDYPYGKEKSSAPHVSGDTYYLAGQPTFYHNFYGARFSDGARSIDGISREDHENGKKALFDAFYDGK